MKSNTKEKIYQEEKDFFLTYLNKKIAEIDQELKHIDETQSENFDNIKMKIILLQNKEHFQNIKEHYYVALKKQSKQNQELFEQNKLYSQPETQSIIEEKYTIKEILNLVFLGKFLKNQKNCDDLLVELKNTKITQKSLIEIRKFYENIFSLQQNQNNFPTIDQRFTFSQNFLEIFVNQQHQLFSHFSKMQSRISQIMQLSYIQNKNPSDLTIKKRNESFNQKKEKKIKFCNQNMYISEEERLNEHKKIQNEQQCQNFQINESVSGYQSDSAGGYSDYIKYYYTNTIKQKPVKTENYYGDSEKSANVEERRFERIMEFDEADLKADNDRAIKSDGESDTQNIIQRNKRKQYHKKLRKFHQEQKSNIKKLWDQQEKQLDKDDFLLIKKKQYENKKLMFITQTNQSKDFDTDKDQKI